MEVVVDSGLLLQVSSEGCSVVVEDGQEQQVGHEEDLSRLVERTLSARDSQNCSSRRPRAP